MSQIFPISFNGDFTLNNVIGTTGFYPNRHFILDGTFSDDNLKYKLFDSKFGDIFYDVDMKKYEVQGFNKNTGPLFYRKLVVRELPEGNTGYASLNPSVGKGFIVRPSIFSDMIKSIKQSSINEKFNNFLFGTSNCIINNGTKNAGILCAKNITNDVDESVIFNEVCNMSINIMSDQNLKKDIQQCPSVNSSTQFSKFMAVNTFEYKFKNDDDSAPMRRGFIAQNVQSQFPELVKTTYQKESIVYKDSNNNWIDENENIVDTNMHSIIIDSEHPDKGKYYTTMNRKNICIDSIAMFETLWVTIQKLIEENENLKARVDNLEST